VPTFSIRSLKINELVRSLCPYCERQAKCNTVHLRMLIHFAVLTYLVCSRCLGRSGYLLILRFTPRGFHRLRLDTTRSSRISSRIAWCKFFLA